MELKGKPLSLGAKIIGALIALVGLGVKAIWAPNLPYDDVLKAAAFVVLIFTPVDVSLWLENIFQKKPSIPGGPEGGSA